ncbi:Mrp/NBP35 family ATP-binding protein [Tropicimonas sp. TH_r6]|uniref:Mrp/NBP35 family ATP-binding protein n=1 Tax=Tropicimonas sp. TH_r6 TaxID=3082085 RepID=UPI002952C643|nr:Mrp/NBP35 family ATP-binding protein [Tropicimonas sp. TH_r6]MDV7142624.1 Mrp/NBP35 family ATP-binding protein [Tropicimonas sp. TH_r6]
MAVTREEVVKALGAVNLPDGGDLVSRDLVRAVNVDSSGRVSFVIEAESADAARSLEPVRQAAEGVVARLEGVSGASAVLTAHSAAKPGTAAPAGAPPNLKVGRHPTAQPSGPQTVPGIGRILLVGSGKGGVGKSTVSANLAVALAQQGRRVGLLDADIYGPSQPRMMGTTKRPASPDGKVIEPLYAHGVTLMSMGSLLKEAEAVIWRGPMLMGALQQMLGDVAWGELDVLIIDLPPGTGDVQLTLGQKYRTTGAIVVSTPQDVALLDARRAIDMFSKLNVPLLGLIENMSTYICPNCGHEAHLFGHGGVAAEAQKLDVPFLGALPLELETRLAGDSGRPVALEDGSAAEAYAALAARLVGGGMA